VIGSLKGVLKNLAKFLRRSTVSNGGVPFILPSGPLQVFGPHRPQCNSGEGHGPVFPPFLSF
jgi:hypothetical protein